MITYFPGPAKAYLCIWNVSMALSSSLYRYLASSLDGAMLLHFAETCVQNLCPPLGLFCQLNYYKL